jgi:hypothetical protein
VEFLLRLNGGTDLILLQSSQNENENMAVMKLVGAENLKPSNQTELIFVELLDEGFCEWIITVLG